MVDVLYHGSFKQNLKCLTPFEDSHNKSYVYAVSEEAFAVIFINRPGGSLVASWGRLKDGTPYYCERKKGIFEKNYANMKGSVYKVEKKHFKQKPNLWKEEFISEHSIKPLREIKISNLKEYLLKLESKGKIKIIFFKDRKKYFSNIDNEILETAKKLIAKYGFEKILPNLKKHQPQIARILLQRTSNNNRVNTKS